MLELGRDDCCITCELRKTTQLCVSNGEFYHLSLYLIKKQKTV